MKKILRPHHGMCFQFYEGKGYSEDFTDHMGKIISGMEEDSSKIITLASKTDIVCEKCPNNKEGICTSMDKVEHYDSKVLEICGLKEGDSISYADFIGTVKEKILDTGLRSEICGDCAWDAICREKSK